MHRALFAGAAASVLALALLGTADAQAGPGCKVATLKGAYAYTVAGFAPKNVPASALRRVTFDGDGNWSGDGPRVLDGQVKDTVIRNGTYDVNADCTVNFKYQVFDADGTFLDSDELSGLIINEKKVAVLLTFDSSGTGTYTSTFEKLELAK